MINEHTLTHQTDTQSDPDTEAEQEMEYSTAKAIAIPKDDYLSTGESLLIVAALCTLAASLLSFSLL